MWGGYYDTETRATATPKEFCEDLYQHRKALRKSWFKAVAFGGSYEVDYVFKWGKDDPIRKCVNEVTQACDKAWLARDKEESCVTRLYRVYSESGYQQKFECYRLAPVTEWVDGAMDPQCASADFYNAIEGDERAKVDKCRALCCVLDEFGKDTREEAYGENGAFVEQQQWSEPQEGSSSSESSEEDLRYLVRDQDQIEFLRFHRNNGRHVEQGDSESSNESSNESSFESSNESSLESFSDWASSESSEEDWSYLRQDQNWVEREDFRRKYGR